MDGDRVRVSISPCKDFTASSVELFAINGKVYADSDDEKVWAIEARSGPHVKAVILGDVPPGYAELVPLEALPLERRLGIVMAPRHGFYNSSFEVGQLQSDAYLVAGSFISKQRFESGEWCR